MPVVVIAPNDALLEKVKSNMQEVKARGVYYLFLLILTVIL
jgi:glucosamine 6-phosphate synthetase-like amidotransferase/phosphosugar isomerase protein